MHYVLWWNANANRFPGLAKVAQIYLAPPPTSVPSERLFSVAGGIITDHRAKLIPGNAEKLIFLKYISTLM
jgi:hAT family C-terminal dimerisation region